MSQILILSAICALIATTISESTLFRNFRLWAKSKGHYFGAGVGCGYCCGHWVAFCLVVVYRPRVVHSEIAMIDYLLTTFLIAWLSAFQWLLLVGLTKACDKKLSKEVA